MKLIRNKATLAFFTQDARWTDDIEKAWHFTVKADASTAAKQFNLQNVELYYSFDHPRFDFTMPL